MQHQPGAVGSDSTSAMLRAMHDAMMQDAAIRARVLARPALRAQQQRLESIGAVDSVPKAGPGRPASRRPAAAPAARPPAPKPAPGAAPKPTRPPPV
jgi:hypothetical protein